MTADGKTTSHSSRKSRYVLAFFSTSDSGSELAAVRVGKSGVRTNLSDQHPDAPPKLKHYAELRLPGERLLVFETAPAESQHLLDVIRRQQPSGLFLLPEVFRNPTEPLPFDDRSLEWAHQAARSEHPIVNSPVHLTERSLQALGSSFEDAVGDLAASTVLGHVAGPSANWILENGYLVRNEVEEMRRGLEGSGRKADRRANFAQVHALAHGLLLHHDHEVTAEAIDEALREFQTVRTLSTAELWSFALMLRLALLEELARLAADSARVQQHREAAYLWADRLITASRKDVDGPRRILPLMANEPYATKGAFLAAMTELLQGDEDVFPAFQTQAEHNGQTLTEIVRAENAQEATRSRAASRAFGSLRALGRLDIRKVFEKISVVDAELRHDPTGVYAASDFETRDRCRQAVERIARWSDKSEQEIARLAVALAEEQTDQDRRQVPWFLVSGGIEELERRSGARLPMRVRTVRAIRRSPVFLYMLMLALLIAGFETITLEIAYRAGVAGILLLSILGALALFPLSELAIQIVHALIIATFPPSRLPRMDYENGIPDNCATLVVVPMMLVDEASSRSELEKLEVRYLGNRDRNMWFALFADFLDAPEQHQPGDAALVETVCSGIAELNQRYPGGSFALFHRDRQYSEGEQNWIGRERKRGKIEDLNRFLTGHGSSEILIEGQLPREIHYVITLDADTALPPSSGRRLVETIAHPCNRVRVDQTAKVRTSGYTIIQPRVAIALPGATATRFTRAFADTTGLDPYCRSVSDIQQDYFNEGSYHGKAIYEVAAFETILGGRFPEETLLSHDLIEGAHAGVGLATDIELLESIPLDYPAFSRRQHRWIRGDWQIAPWLFANVPGPNGPIPNPLGAVSRWKIFDNLRRSLVPVASLLLLLFGWIVSVAPTVWSVVVALAIAIPALAPLLDRWARHLEGSVHGRQGAMDELIRSAVMTAFLPHQAWLAVDAIARVFYRSRVSHRHMLEWVTAEAAGRTAHIHGNLARQQMYIIAGVSAVMMPMLHHWGRLAATAPFLLLWMASPLLLLWLNRTAKGPRSGSVTDNDREYLVQAARLGWRFFDDLVSEENNWLPPDNTQLALRIEVAPRTSPTNIGLWLTSALTALDFGWLTPIRFTARCLDTFSTLDKLERQDGHLYNWYDIHSLQPLNPHYISTADSGNFLACLWVMDRAVGEIVDAPLLDRRCLSGLLHTLGLVTETAGEDPYLSVPCRAASRLLRAELRDHELIVRLRLVSHSAQPFRDAARWSSGSDNGAGYWAARFADEVTAWAELVDTHLKWVETLSRPADAWLLDFGRDVPDLRREVLSAMPSLRALAAGIPALRAILDRPRSPEMSPETTAWLSQLAQEVEEAEKNAAAAMARLDTLQDSIRHFADAMNMRSLYDEDRRHFAVGYIANGPRALTSHYDLLASEARLASFVSIAKGDVPLEHWFALGRPMRTEPQGRQLLSWSGTMFEFLMPLMFTNSYENSQLDLACSNAVKGQIAFGDRNGVPWGLSESAYSALDNRQTYQYRAFGVQGLAQNPDADDRLVISPYSTMLALMVDVRAGVNNLRRLEGRGMKGPMGFYEAIDYSRSSSREGEKGITIYAYMAHHQGMSLAALNNVLNGNILRRRFHSDPRIRAVESLLFERIPLARLRVHERAPAPLAPTQIDEPPAERTLPPVTVLPQTLLLGNGRYSVMMTNSGSGYSRWKGNDVTRWRADASLDSQGTFVFLRERPSPVVWSAAWQPARGDHGECSVTFSANRAEFRRSHSGIESALRVAVSADDDVEVRRLTLSNHTRRRRPMEITSFAELAMAPHAADAGHPAFSKLFVETESAGEGVIVAHRRPRSPEEPPIWVAHLIVGASGHIECETSRKTFLGRARRIGDAEALNRKLNGTTGAVLDAVAALRCREVLEPLSRIELSFLTMAAPSREELMKMVARYSHQESPTRVLELAWTHAQLEFRHLQIDANVAHSYQRLASYLIYPASPLRNLGFRQAPAGPGQRDLWALGISGDLPIVTVTLREEAGLNLVREVLGAHAYWRARGFMADLVILNQEAAGYDRPLNFQLQRILDAHAREVGLDKPGGVFLRDTSVISDAQRLLILSSSRAVLAGARGPLERQLPAVREPAAPANAFVPVMARVEEPSPSLPFLELNYFNGTGGFSQDGREYCIYLGPGTVTPTPWVNVIATPDFGCMVTESGLGFTWHGNSQQRRLTTWQNDPVCDPQSEAIYLRDEDTGSLWTPTALPIREDDAYRARHGHGYSVFDA